MLCLVTDLISLRCLFIIQDDDVKCVGEYIREEVRREAKDKHINLGVICT